MSTPFVGICSGGPLNGQKMARLESSMEVFEADLGLLGDDDLIPSIEGFEFRVAGVYEYSGYGLWSWVPGGDR